MKKTLYISDLDGTLLNEHEKFSPYTIDFINNFVADGGLFSVATARSLQNAKELLSVLSIEIPVVFSSGVVVYDLKQDKYLNVHPFPLSLVQQVQDIVNKSQTSAFLYAIEDGKTHIFYNKLYDDKAELYVQQRMERYNGLVFQKENLLDISPQTTPLNFVLYNTYGKIEPIYKEISMLSKTRLTLFEDVYNDCTFMEIFSDATSKATGAEIVKQIVGADEVVAFGDNYNDLELLEQADRSYVTANGVGAAKKIATGVIGRCGEDGVVKFIEQDIKSTPKL